MDREIDSIKGLLEELKRDGKILVAILYGSYAKGIPHRRSDIDIALYIKAEDGREEMAIIDKILLSVDRDVSILRLDDEDESPFVVQEALKGTPLIEPDIETVYGLWHRVLHQCEDIRFRRGLSNG